MGGGVVILLFVKVLILAYRLNQPGGLVGRVPGYQPSYWRRILTMMCVFGLALFMLGVALPFGRLAWLGLPLVFFPLWSWPVTWRWLVPKGWVQTADMLMSLGSWRWHNDLNGGVDFARAAALRKAQPSVQMLQFEQTRLDTSQMLTAGRVAAWALLEGQLGRSEQSLRVMRSVALFPCQSSSLRELVFSYRLGVACERGRFEWFDGPMPKRMAPLPKLMAGVALALGRNTEAPDDDDLLNLAQACERPDVLCRVQSLLAVRTGAAVAQEPDLAQLLGMHLSATTAPTRATLQRAFDGWCLTKDVGALALASQALDELRELAKDRQIPLQANEAGSDHAQARLAALQQQAHAMHRRLAQGRFLSPMQELLDFISLTRIYDEVHDPSDRLACVMAFHAIHPAVEALSLSMYNDQEQPMLACALWNWLLQAATDAGNDRVVEILRGNLGLNPWSKVRATD